MPYCQGLQRSNRPALRALGYLRSWLCVLVHSCAAVTMADTQARLDLDDLPALLPQLLQSPCARNAVLPPHVERERRVEGRLPAARRAYA